ncbi:hypothetical protein [Bifidobacterium choerinum]
MKEFAFFIETEQLDDRDTILRIDSRLPVEEKRPDIVDEFDAIAQRTIQLGALSAGQSIPEQLLVAYRPPQDGKDDYSEKDDIETRASTDDVEDTVEAADIEPYKEEA